MTIYAPPPPPFTCAICLTDWEYSPWIGGWSPTLPIQPVCVQCNQTWGKAVGGWADHNRDRRIIRQISALAAAIDVEAHRAQSRRGPLYARA